MAVKVEWTEEVPKNIGEYWLFAKELGQEEPRISLVQVTQHIVTKELIFKSKGIDLYPELLRNALWAKAEGTIVPNKPKAKV